MAARPIAWVNLLSIYASSTFRLERTFSASLQRPVALAMPARGNEPSGVRVINVFPVHRRRVEPALPPPIDAARVAKPWRRLMDGVEDVSRRRGPGVAAAVAGQHKI